MTLIVTWLWQGLAIAWITAAAVRVMPRLNAATRHAVWWLALAAVLVIPIAHELAAITSGTPSLRDLTPVDAAGALTLPAIPDGVIAGAAAVWAMIAAFHLLADRPELPGPRPAEARLVAIRPLARSAPAAVGGGSGRTPPGGGASNRRLRDRCVRARTRPSCHPHLARGRRRAQRRIAGRDRDARAGASRSLRRLVAAAAGRRRQPRRAASGGALPRPAAGCRPRGRLRRSRRVVHGSDPPLCLRSACRRGGVDSGSGADRVRRRHAGRDHDGVGVAGTGRPAPRSKAQPGSAARGCDEPRQCDGSGPRRRHLDAGGPSRGLLRWRTR